VTNILQILGVDHEVSAKGTSIGTTKFEPELKTLTLIMFSNLYPLSNMGFINLGRAQFLCDLLTGAPIDICAHIFRTIGKTVERTAAQMYLPFCSFIMKIMVLKGVFPPRDGMILVRQRPISMVTLQMRKVTLLLNGKNKICPKHQRVNLFNMSLLPVTAQFLTLPLDIPRLHLLTFLSCKLLALN